MSKGSGSNTTTQKADPWAGQQPYLLDLYAKAQNLPVQQFFPGQTYATPSDLTYTAEQLAEQAALGPQTSIAGSILPSLEEQLMSPAQRVSDPLLQESLRAALSPMEESASRLLQQTRRGATGAGQLGGTRQGILESEVIKDLLTKQSDVARQLYGDIYGDALTAQGRALGLGVLGWHTLLQQNGIAFEGLLAQFKTREIFSKIKIESERASRKLAEVYGEPLWCVGTGMRNTHLRAIAPTVSNSKLSGNISPGIEPWAANVFTDQSAKGTFIRRNPTLEIALKEHNLNTDKVWDQILADNGSVQNLPHDVLTESEKEIFLTFSEVNQLELVRQAAIRQKYIDQTQSLNLSFDPTDSPKWINQCHLEAWKLGVKTLYYLRTDSVIKGDLGSRTAECIACDG